MPSGVTTLEKQQLFPRTKRHYQLLYKSFWSNAGRALGTESGHQGGVHPCSSRAEWSPFTTTSQTLLTSFQSLRFEPCFGCEVGLRSFTSATAILGGSQEPSDCTS